MTDLRKAAEMALEALEFAAAQIYNEDNDDIIADAITALRQALEQPEQEPVAWIDEFGNVFPLGAQRGPKYLNEPMKPLYTASPKRKWVGLTDEEEIELDEKYGDDFNAYIDARDAKLKEKNRG